MKNLFRIFLLLLLAGSALALTACKDDDEAPEPNEEETITRVRLTLTPVGGGTAQVVVWSQPGGPGTPVEISAAPVLDNISYTTEVEFFDNSKTPMINVTEEIEEEADEHQLFITFPTNPGSTSWAATDLDANSRPIGLRGQLNAGATDGSGQMRITLKHQPGLKNQASNPNAGNIALGETDVEVTFPFTVN